MSAVAEARAAAVASTMHDIRAIEARHGVTRAGVEAIRDRLVELASQRDLFPLDDFPGPGDDDEARSWLYRLAQDDDEVDTLYDYIVTYLGKLSQENLQARQSAQLYTYMSAANNVENIADMIETNIVETGLARLRNNVQVSEQTEAVLKALHEKVSWAVQLALESLDASDLSMAEQAIGAKEEINRLAGEAETHLALRLAAEEENRLVLYRIESEIIEYLKRVYYFAKRIAKAVVETEMSDLTEEAEEALEEVMKP